MNISNCIKIKRSSQTKFYMQLNSIINCKKKKDHWLQKIEDYNLTKQKYFEYIQLYKKKKSRTKFKKKN